MPPTHGHLSDLVSLISDATKVVEAHFARTSKPYVPSLDDIEPHPLDSTAFSAELKFAIQTIEGACTQLMLTVAKPTLTIVNKSEAVTEPTCLGVVAANKIAELLHEQPTKGMHISEIAKRTGLQRKKLERIMRHLVTRHVFRESTNGVFMNNRLSVQLLNAYNPGMREMVQYTAEELAGAASCLTDVLADEEWGHSDAPYHTAFNKRTGYTKSLFDYYSGRDSVKGAELGVRFSLMMLAWGAASEGTTVVNDFPWKDLRKGTTVVDVGSGIGTITLELAKHHPQLKLVLQDIPERMLEARQEIWPKECPDAVAEGRVEFREIDFFKQSPVSGADIYYMKNIMYGITYEYVDTKIAELLSHDWEDNLAIKIMRNVRKAMAPGSRLLIHEYVLQDATRSAHDEQGVTKAPEPLLPNFGLGGIRPYALDMCMLIMFNSVERRLLEFISLGKEADLRFVRLWDLGETAVIEFAPSQRISGKL